jgi:hypothetical protein
MWFENIANYIDTDGDGLANVFEGLNVNDPFDVNGEINVPSANLPNADGYVNFGGNV